MNNYRGYLSEASVTDKSEINANIKSEKLADVFKQVGGEGLEE